jgi:hypothetical protein
VRCAFPGTRGGCLSEKKDYSLRFVRLSDVVELVEPVVEPVKDQVVCAKGSRFHQFHQIVSLYMRMYTRYAYATCVRAWRVRAYARHAYAWGTLVDGDGTWYCTVKDQVDVTDAVPAVGLGSL